MTKGKKPARNFGGRPVEFAPDPSKRVHLSTAVPLVLKRALEREAAKQGWSVSTEVTYRLNQSFVWLTALKALENVAASLADRIKQLEEKETKK